MSGVRSNGCLEPESANYDYFQETNGQSLLSTGPQQQTHHTYYQPQAASYSANNHHQYYPHQQPINTQYYSQDTLPQHQQPWTSPQGSHMHSHAQYHPQQPYYGHQQAQTQYHHSPHQNYHPQIQQHPMHQLNAFVNHTPQPPPPSQTPTPHSTATTSPASSIHYPSSTPSPNLYVAQAPASPQRSLSPTRPGPSSSPGTISNHMMPVRLQNMAKGARTKAGMRKLMQMQEHQGQTGTAISPPLKVTPPGSPKKVSKARKSPSKELPNSKDSKTEGETSLNSSTSSSIDEAIEAAVLRSRNSSVEEPVLTSDDKISEESEFKETSLPTHPPSAGAKSKAKISQLEIKQSIIQVPAIDHPLFIGCGPNPRVIKKRRLSASPDTSNIRKLAPSDLLFEKLGLHENTGGVGKLVLQTKARSTPASMKKRRMSSPSSDPDESKSSTRSNINETNNPSALVKKPRTVVHNPRTRQSFSTSNESSDNCRRISSSCDSTPTKHIVPKQTKNEKSASIASPNTRRSQLSTSSVDSCAQKQSPSSTRRGLAESNGRELLGYGGIETSIAVVAAAIVAPGIPIIPASVQKEPEPKVVEKHRRYKRRNKLQVPTKRLGRRVQISKKSRRPGMCSFRHNKGPESSSEIEVDADDVSEVSEVRARNSGLHTKVEERSGKKQVNDISLLKKGVSRKVTRSSSQSYSESGGGSKCPEETEEVFPKSRPGVGGEVSWMVSLLEKRPREPKKLKTPTVKVKGFSLVGTLPELKKETIPGPSLKVKHGVVKFYRGSEEDDVDESLKKLDTVLKESMKKEDCEDDDSPWVCIFCGLGPHDMRLGDLFGPYYVDLLTPERSVNGRSREGRKEVWVHTDCALWAGDVILVGSTLRNLDETVREAEKVVCNICGNMGATIGCLKRGCTETAHFPCARLNDWNLMGETFHSHCRAHLPEMNEKMRTPSRGVDVSQRVLNHEQCRLRVVY